MLSSTQIQQFQQQGFLHLPVLLAPAQLKALQALALAHLQARVEPFEMEAQTGYPGAPAAHDQPGGQTIRRLLGAYDRASEFSAWGGHPRLVAALANLLGSAPTLVRAHHNCIMTKQATYSSQTHWHQDIRYWSFSNSELISAWLALGEEKIENGCLWVLPGSHQWHLRAEQLDEKKFLRTDLPDNQILLSQAMPVTLQPGEVLLFHARTLHAAGLNATQAVKFALVYTYHGAHTQPLSGTRSALQAEVPLTILEGM